MQSYEALVIVDPRPTEEEVAALLTQLGEQLKTLGGDVVKMENWGKRRLADHLGQHTRPVNRFPATSRLARLTPADMDVSVEQFYEQASEERQARIDIALDAHLPEIFLTRRRKESKPAADIVSRHKTELIDNITYWTGVQRPIIRGLIESICRTCERMKLWGALGEEPRYLVEVTALATVLAVSAACGLVTGPIPLVPLREVELLGPIAARKWKHEDIGGDIVSTIIAAVDSLKAGGDTLRVPADSPRARAGGG